MKAIHFIIVGAILLLLLHLVSHLNEERTSDEEIGRVRVPTEEEQVLRRRIHEKLMSVLPQDKFEIKVKVVREE
jgi:large-conductance mechanosensitive channel